MLYFSCKRKGLTKFQRGVKVKLLKRSVEKSKKALQKGTVDYNAKKIQKRYPLNKYGYFGKKGNGARVIYTYNHEKAAKCFYFKISKGGKRSLLTNGHGEQKQ